MPFISDLETLRIYDPERNFELFRTSGGSDGRVGRRLVAPSGECRFDSYLSFRDATLAERRLRPEIGRTGVWRLSNADAALPGMTMQETYNILAEAVAAERLSVRDLELHWTALVPLSLDGNAGGSGSCEDTRIPGVV